MISTVEQKENTKRAAELALTRFQAGDSITEIYRTMKREGFRNRLGKPFSKASIHHFVYNRPATAKPAPNVATNESAIKTSVLSLLQLPMDPVKNLKAIELVMS